MKNPIMLLAAPAAAIHGKSRLDPITLADSTDMLAYAAGTVGVDDADASSL